MWLPPGCKVFQTRLGSAAAIAESQPGLRVAARPVTLAGSVTRLATGRGTGSSQLELISHTMCRQILFRVSLGVMAFRLGTGWA